MTMPRKEQKRESRRLEKAETAGQVEKVCMSIYLALVTICIASFLFNRGKFCIRKFPPQHMLFVCPQSIEKELLERLKKGVYGDIYNYPVKEYNKVLDMESLEALSEDEEVRDT